MKHIIFRSETSSVLPHHSDKIYPLIGLDQITKLEIEINENAKILPDSHLMKSVDQISPNRVSLV